MQTHATSCKHQLGHQKSKCGFETCLWLIGQMIKFITVVRREGRKLVHLSHMSFIPQEKHFKKHGGITAKEKPDHTRFVPLGLRSHPLKVYYC